MIFRTVILVASLLLTTLSFANDKAPLNNDVNIVLGGVEHITPARLFLADYENNYMFIDFEESPTQILSVKIYQGDKLIQVDNVSDLPKSTIYEVNFDDLERNVNYQIKLETQGGNTINKEFVIN